MNYLHRLVIAALMAAFFMAPAHAQNLGTVTDHAFALGRGAAQQGFRSLICGTTQVPIGQTSADPICAALSGDVTMTAVGVTAIGAGKVTNAQHATMPANTTKCNATAGVATPTDCTAATMRTNLGLVIGTNVEAWDTDLDCLAALSSTGVISRTGGGTCSAGALALSGLATGTQDTVIGYFGSTTASATAISNCTGALTYSTATHTFGCNASAGTGTVTSVTCASTVITTTGTCYSAGQVVGTATNDNATSGNFGEYASSNRSSGAALSLTSNTQTNIVATLSLTAGDWDVSGVVAFSPGGSTVTTSLLVGINTVSATTPSIDSGQLSGMAFGAGVTGGATMYLTSPVARISISGTTTVYLVANAVFTTSTMSSWGNIRARRAR